MPVELPLEAFFRLLGNELEKKKIQHHQVRAKFRAFIDEAGIPTKNIAPIHKEIILSFRSGHATLTCHLWKSSERKSVLTNKSNMVLVEHPGSPNKEMTPQEAVEYVLELLAR